MGMLLLVEELRPSLEDEFKNLDSPWPTRCCFWARFFTPAILDSSRREAVAMS